MAALGDESHDGAFVGGAAGLLGNGCKTAGTQNVDGLLDIAFSLGQGLLAFHHASAGHLTEFLDESCGDFCHGNSFLGLRRLEAAQKG